MDTDIPKPAKKRLAVARRYSCDRNTNRSVGLGFVVRACAGTRTP